MQYRMQVKGADELLQKELMSQLCTDLPNKILRFHTTRSTAPDFDSHSMELVTVFDAVSEVRARALPAYVLIQQMRI